MQPIGHKLLAEPQRHPMCADHPSFAAVALHPTPPSPFSIVLLAYQGNPKATAQKLSACCISGLLFTFFVLAAEIMIVNDWLDGKQS